MANIRKYDASFSRRVFLSNTGKALLRAGVLCSAWSAFSRTGSASSAYPDELLSIDQYTKGKLSPGYIISEANVDQFKELLNPVLFEQIKEMGRKLKVIESTNDLHRLCPYDFVEATLRNAGQAAFDKNGNVVMPDGKPWVGGIPFPEPNSGKELFASHTLSWGRHDVSFYATKQYDLNSKGDVKYEYTSCWAEMQANSRVAIEAGLSDKERQGLLRYQSVFFLEPSDSKGISYLNIWPYDQSSFPDLYGYLPAFKRVRRYPTNQRFEPLVAGSQLYLSDAWGAGDPYLTWGNYRIVDRKPMLAAVSGNWNSQSQNWQHATHGGASGNLFWDTTVELVPEVIVVEAEPVKFPRAPVSKKRVWFDARTSLPLAMISYDRQGNPFRYFDGAYSVYENVHGKVLDGLHPYWSWTHLHAFNIQTGYVTRIEQVDEVRGGHKMKVNDPNVYSQYLTIPALRRLGG